ncbi:MAG: hypothetical protein ACYTBZ_06275 [Planctomycetota bacterium]
MNISSLAAGEASAHEGSLHRGGRRYRWAETLVCALALLVGFIVSPQPSLAGPPLITDDPDTPGKGGWEINLSYNLEVTRERIVELMPSGRTRTKLHLAREHMVPLLDINYGLMENDQWKIEFPLLIEREPDGTYQRGIGDLEVGWKFRFLEQDQFPVSLSIYPQAVIPTGDHRRGLGASKPQYVFPLQIGRHFGDDRLFLYGEVGYAAFMARDQDDGWFYGLAVEYQLFEGFDILGEINGKVPVTGPSHPHVLFNLGCKYQLSEYLKLIVAMGRSFSAQDGDGPVFIGFWGLQIMF